MSDGKEGFPHPGGGTPQGQITGDGLWDVYAAQIFGNDGYPGTIGLPVLTIARAVAIQTPGLGQGGKGGLIRLAGSAAEVIDQQGAVPIVGAGPIQTFGTGGARLDIPQSTTIMGGGANSKASSGKANTWIMDTVGPRKELIRPGTGAGLKNLAVTNRSATGDGVNNQNPRVHNEDVFIQGCGRHGMVYQTNGSDGTTDLRGVYAGNGGCGVYLGPSDGEPPSALTFQSTRCQGNGQHQWLYDSVDVGLEGTGDRSVGGKEIQFIECIAMGPGGFAALTNPLIEERGGVDHDWSGTYLESTGGAIGVSAVVLTRGGVMGISAITLVSGTTYRYTLNRSTGEDQYLANAQSVTIVNATPAGYSGTYTVTNATATTVDLDIGSNPAPYNPSTTIAQAFLTGTRYSRNVSFRFPRFHHDITSPNVCMLFDYAEGCSLMFPTFDVAYTPSTTQPLVRLTANSRGNRVLIGPQPQFAVHPTPEEMVQDAGTGNLIGTWNNALGRYTGSMFGASQGLTGAVAATRYVGGTTSGAPITGTFAKGDFIIAQDGVVWICTTAGSPGTWKASGPAANTSGTFATRPTAGQSGRLYLATDIAGGMTYMDTGAAWLPLSTSAAAEMAATLTFTGNGQAANTDVLLWAPWTIPANFLAVGTTFEILVGLDTDVLSSGTARNLIYKLKLGGTTFATGTQVVTVSVAITNQAYFLRFLVACYATGAAGTVKVQGAAEIAAASTGANLKTGVPFGTPVGGSTLDTTVAQAVTLTVAESVNSVADVIRAETGRLIVLGA